MLAPRNLVFYDKNWQSLGSRLDLVDVLISTTAIPGEVITGEESPQSYPIAQRMSWASKRKTSRVEDKAYSLLGLFDITSLQMNYGEREKAFIRLQEEIIKNSADESIFAWALNASTEFSGLLASSPADFSDCGHIRPWEERTYAFDNLGMSLELPTQPYSFRVLLAGLNVAHSEGTRKIGILISRVDDDRNQYVRVKNSKGQSRFPLTDKWLKNATLLKVRMRQQLLCHPNVYFPGFWLRTVRAPAWEEYDIKVSSRGRCNILDHIQLPPDGVEGTVGLVELIPKVFRCQYDPRQLRWFMFGFNKDSRPVCAFANSDPWRMKKLEDVKTLVQDLTNSDSYDFQQEFLTSLGLEWMEDFPSGRSRPNAHWDYGRPYWFSENPSETKFSDSRGGFEFSSEYLNLSIEISAVRNLINHGRPSLGTKDYVWIVDIRSLDE